MKGRRDCSKRMTKKEYKNVIRSRAALHEGLIGVLNDGVPLEKVTVSLVCNRAGVNRGTFYNHYKAVSELANEIEMDYLRQLEDSFSDIGIDDHESRVSFFDHVNQVIDFNRATAYAVTKCMPYSFRGDLQSKIAETNRRHFKSVFLSRYGTKALENELEVVSVGIAALYSAVIVGKCSMSKEEVAFAAVSLLDRLDPKMR